MRPACCGRARQDLHKTAAGVDEEPKFVERAEAPAHVIAGARGYARQFGLPDPHDGQINFHEIRSSASLLREIAHHYDRLPEHDPNAEQHFESMRQEINRQHDFMTHKMGIHTEVSDEDPYDNFKQLHHDVMHNRRIQVLSDRATGGHPFFSPEENEKFRAVHDVFGHVAAGGGFDRHGEEAAFHAHALMFSPHARPALASETRGQFASSVVNGRFGPQRIAVMPRHLWTPQHSRFANKKTATDWHQFDTNHWYRAGHQDGARGDFTAHDYITNLMNQGHKLDPEDIDYMVGHEHGMERARSLAEGNARIRKMFETAPEYNSVEHQVNMLGHELRHRESKLDIDEYRLNRHLQERRAEEATGGYRSETDSYFGRDGNTPTEAPFTFKDYLKHTSPAKEGESFRTDREAYRLGHQWGSRHRATSYEPSGEFEWDQWKHNKPDHFWAGYTDGINERPMMQAYAVLVGGMDDAPKGLSVVAHVSGNNIDVLHCPFCGSGAVLARSDGTIECGYCTSVFTVQTQPQFNGFPQSVDGQQYQWPGMPDPNAVMAPDTPPGTNVNPMAQGDPLGGGGMMGVGDSSDPADAEGDEDGDDDSGNPFAKGGDDDKKSDKKDDKSDSKDKKKGGNPFGKKSSSLRTAQGAQLPSDEFEAHLAIKYARNPLEVAQRVRQARQKGLLG